MRRINYWLDTKLLDICKSTVPLEEMNNKLISLLPTELKDQCHVGSFKNGCLTITTNNAAWASQLRYIIPELRDKLRQEAGIYQLTSIKILITTDQAPPPTQEPKLSKLSDKSRSAIIDLGDQCDYLPLKEALLKLAKRNKPVV